MAFPPLPKGVHLYQGYHSKDLYQLLKHSWEHEELVVVCPPQLTDFEFVSLLPPATPYPEKPLLGVFTSGTLSGAPRLVLYSKKNIEASLQGILSFFDPKKIEEIFCYPQAFHTFGLTLGYLLSIVHSKKLHFHAGKYSREAHAARATLSHPHLLTLGTPTHFYDLLEYTRAQSITLAPSYSCILGGAPVAVGLWKSVREELKIENPSIGYGATEACPGITHHTPGLEPSEEGEIGSLIPGVEIQMVPQVGIEFDGPSRCLAIIENGAIQFPKKVLIRDLIEVRESDQMLLFKGRSDLILNRGGSKFSLEQIESILLSELGLKTIALPVPDSRLGSDLGLLVEDLVPESIELRTRVQEVLWQKLNHRFTLDTWVSTQVLPLNRNGKFDRAAARSWVFH